MGWVYEVVCRGDHAQAPAAHAWLEAGLRQRWSSLPELSALDLYRPLAGGARDPFNDDGPGPLFLAMLGFPTAEAVQAAIADSKFHEGFEERPNDIALTGTVLERRLYPIDGESLPGPLAAPFSYVVRYHRPADDEQAFITNYVDTHPPTLGKLPGIRSIMCYFPVRGISAPLPAADYIVGNEVAFDDVGAFNIAMQSPVRQELRRHFHEFPAFSGRNTHYPMMRTRVAG